MQATRYEGPYDLESDEEKFAGIARYNRGTEREGFTASLMGYAIEYTAPDQITLRAVQAGRLTNWVPRHAAGAVACVCAGSVKGR